MGWEIWREKVDRGTWARDRTVMNESYQVSVRSQLNAKLFFRFQKLPAKTTEINHFFEEKIEKVGV